MIDTGQTLVRAEMAVGCLGTVRRFFYGLLTAVLLLLAYGGYTAWQIYDYGRQSSARPADAALVLGAAAWGERPSPVFRERINHAVKLYRDGRVRALIFTGGTPVDGYPTEAAVGRRYAIQHGVPAEAILTENDSRTTYGNLVNAAALAEHAGLTSFLIVSDPLHMHRAMMMARDLGLEAYPSPTPSSRYQGLEMQARFLLKETYNALVYRAFRSLS